jgi:hypothetical protein
VHRVGVLSVEGRRIGVFAKSGARWENKRGTQSQCVVCRRAQNQCVCKVGCAAGKQKGRAESACCL